MELSITLDKAKDSIRRFLPLQFQGDSVKGDDGIGYLYYTMLNSEHYVCYAMPVTNFELPLSLAQKNNTALEARGASFEEAEVKLKAILDTFEVTE